VIEAEILGKDNNTTYIDLDAELDLFKLKGTTDFELEYAKWMKQQSIKRDTKILGQRIRVSKLE
jgi:hypothetical protein